MTFGQYSKFHNSVKVISPTRWEVSVRNIVESFPSHVFWNSVWTGDSKKQLFIITTLGLDDSDLEMKPKLFVFHIIVKFV